jgi:dihydroorotate dehydrogenase subfamily 1
MGCRKIKIDKLNGKINFLGKEISGIYTIPSGIVTTKIQIIEKISKEIPEIGVITTKSIGLEPRKGNREPIFAKYKKDSFVNAVGLANIGAKAFAEQLKNAKIPNDKFILTSIFGKSKEEFVEVAKILAPYSDGLELNLSCPHADGYGMAMGQDPIMVKEITRAVKNNVSIPVIPKLTPNVDDIKIIAKAAVEGGADAICAINTYGPYEFKVDDKPVLSNVKGGQSGKDIFDIGLKCIKSISEVVDIPIIGCGGISDADDVRDYINSGSEIIGIGSALVGMTTNEMKNYFSVLNQDLLSNNNNSKKLLKDPDMNYKKFILIENEKLDNDFSLLMFNNDYKIKPGQFVFLWIPGVGEKPFSVLDDKPLVLAIKEFGCFTKEAIRLKPGDEVYIRGPYGQEIELNDEEEIILASGGTGLASFYKFVKLFNQKYNKKINIFIGASDSNHLFYLEELKKYSNVYVATNDGSFGHKGFVTTLLDNFLEKNFNQFNKKIVFYNCGPPAMIDAIIKIEKKYSEKIFNSIDYLTMCGVGICGTCTTKDGLRSCVDGPFMEEKNEN